MRAMANFTIKKINDQGGFRHGNKTPTILEMSKETNEDYCSQIIYLNFLYVGNEIHSLGLSLIQL
jgi:hypothetical protein